MEFTAHAGTAPRRRRTRPWAAALAAGAVAVSAACTADPPDDAVPPSSTVVQPGRPGEGSATVAPQDAPDAVAESGYNQADVDYMTQMIEHHLQALDMSVLAPDRAQDDQVLAIADRINDVQGAEVHGLVAWLQERDLPVPVDTDELEGQGDGSGPRVPDGGHDHAGGTMPGMLSQAQMTALAAADGAEFDRLYLEGMVQHHLGAVEMSVTVLDEGENERVGELATDIGASQEAEIGRLKDILATL
ncbi:DUF305 domain-containing protein [Isoptericola sp. NEAU-Y5]|uniref:DUF305 domain-containing protein n=1 Tax=Isoptericola luteus TaxID=2879484 RepID=A0ABS7ZHQ2_9MICO|nr:DUF305 domain-containing protein [Isoptericola sp. NEAU-Y5]MCA5894448.1 DUF305 domain-containing protein [Isoptericola sp. NEAU-Y5]